MRSASTVRLSRPACAFVPKWLRQSKHACIALLLYIPRARIQELLQTRAQTCGITVLPHGQSRKLVGSKSPHQRAPASGRNLRSCTLKQPHGKPLYVLKRHPRRFQRNCFIQTRMDKKKLRPQSIAVSTRHSKKSLLPSAVAPLIVICGQVAVQLH